MDERQHLAEITVKNRLTNKLHPENYANMSGTMAGVISYLLDVCFVKPTITRIAVTSDGCLLADTDEPRFGCFLVHYRDLIRNWFGLLQVANLNPDKRILAECLFAPRRSGTSTTQ